MSKRRKIVLAAGVMLLCGELLLSGEALAVDQASRPLSPKRQLIACMNRQMAASRQISYNEATKVCKTQLQAQSATLTSSVLAKPVTVLGQ
jgi:hypothetical protein